MCVLTLSSLSICFRNSFIVMFFGCGNSFLWSVNSCFIFVMLFIFFSIYFVLFSVMMVSCKYKYICVITSLGILKLVEFSSLVGCGYDNVNKALYISVGDWVFSIFVIFIHLLYLCLFVLYSGT